VRDDDISEDSNHDLNQRGPTPADLAELIRTHPRPSSPSSESQSRQPKPPVADARKRVVIAEDEALIRLDLKETLGELGYDVVGEAGDGERAVALAEQLRPDLVILDVKMPVLDGISAAQRITSQHIAAVVILTAFSQRDLVERARDAGAMAYLVKPFSSSDLLPAIEMALSRYAQMSALEAEVADLTDRLEARKIIERAKGLLQAKLSITEPDAFRWIQRAAMDQRVSMRAVAEVVVEGAAGGAEPS
jgi:response regulator NasT